MKVIKGNKSLEMSREEILSILAEFEKTEVDLGTGDGRFVYQKAKENPKTFYIGVDPSEKQLEVFSKKAVKDKLSNSLFVLGSLELLPEELRNIADKVYVIFPWGSLLKAISVPTEKSINSLKSFLRKNSEVEVVLGYDPQSEPSETQRLNLPQINENYLKNSVFPVFERFGLSIKSFKQLGKEDLSEIGSSWGKKLKFGNERPIFKLTFLA